MKIAGLETVPYALPFEEPYVTARGRLERRELLLLKLKTSGGPTGLGETVAMSLRGGPELAAIERELHDTCTQLLTGLKITASNLAGTISGVAASGVSPAALAAVDLALHDLLGRIEGAPVWELLGAPGASPVRCNATLVAGEPEAVAADAERWIEDGFDTVKMKVGVDGDVAQVAAVRDRIGPGVRIRVDANGAWSAEQAIEKLNSMAGHGIEFAEQPTADLVGLVQTRRAVRVPIAADESVTNLAEAHQAIDSGACDLATAKLVKVGGIAAGLELAAEVPIYLSSALDGPLGIAAAFHLAQAMPQLAPARGLAQGLATQRLYAATIARVGPELDGPMLSVADEPGLGVEIDELALARMRLR